MKDKLLRVAMRFVRGFVAGAVASALAFLLAGTPPSDFAQLQVIAFPVFIGGLTGGLLALDKYFRDVPAQEV